MVQESTNSLGDLVEQYQAYSDETVLQELTALAVLPDEDDPSWDDESTWLQLANPYLALAEIAAERRLQPALSLLLGRASYGDPFEIMRRLRHYLEQIVDPNWDILTQVCLAAAKSPQRGARLWAIDELGVLRDKQALGILLDALDDDASIVQCQACQALEMLCQTHTDCRFRAVRALTAYLNEQHTDSEMRSAHRALSNIKAMK